MTRSGIARAAAAVALVTVAARVVGLVRTTVMSATVGDSAFVGNTYGTANTLPNIVFEIVAGGALAGLVVPVLAGAVARRDTTRVDDITSGLLTWTVLVLTPVALLGVVLARPLMTLLTVGVDDPVVRAAEVDLGARMLLVFMPQVVLYGIGIVLTGVLQSHRRFVGPAVAPLLSSAVVIGVYLVYAAVRGPGLPGTVGRTEELVLSVGTTLGVVVLSLSLVVPMRALGMRLRPMLRMPPGVGRQVRALALAAGVGVIAQQIALLVALAVVNARPGAVVAYQLAYTVFLLPWGVLAVPIATSAFPALAASADDSTEEYATTVADATRALLVVCAGAAAVTWAVHAPAAQLLPFRPTGAADVAGRSAVGDGIAAFSVGLVPYALLALLTRALFARGRTRSAAVGTASGFAVAALASVVLARLVPDRPVLAVATAHSAGMVVAAVLLVAAASRDSGGRTVRGVGRTAARSVAAALPAAAVGAALAATADARSAGDAVVSGLLAATASAVVYVGVLALLRTPELRAVTGLLPRGAAGG